MENRWYTFDPSAYFESQMTSFGFRVDLEELEVSLSILKNKVYDEEFLFNASTTAEVLDLYQY